LPHLRAPGWSLRRGAGSAASRLPRPPAWAARDATARLGLNVMKEASFGGTLRRVIEGASQKEAIFMLHAGLDLSRKRLDYCLLDQDGIRVAVGAVSPDRDGLFGFARGVADCHGPVVVRA